MKLMLLHYVKYLHFGDTLIYCLTVQLKEADVSQKNVVKVLPYVFLDDEHDEHDETCVSSG